MLAAIEFELVKAAQLVAFFGAFRANKPKPRARPRNRIVPRVGGADHQSLLSFVACDDGGVGEDEAGAGPRETGENQAGHHRQKRHAGEDFDGRDQMPVIGLRVHVAIADCRQRLDREVEVCERSVLRGIGDRLMAKGIEEAKNGVERDKYRGGRAEKHRPVHCHRAMIEIAPEALAPAKRLDLPVTEPDELRLFL